MRNHDLVFLKHFSQVILFLVGVTLALILLGLYINSKVEPEANPAAVAATEARIRPVGDAYAGTTGAAAQAAAAAGQQAQGAEELAAAIEEISSLADELQSAQ